MPPPTRLLLLGLLGPSLITCPSSAEDTKPTFAPTDQYKVRQIEGWTVLIHAAFLRAQPALADRALTLLRFQLYQIGRRVPAPALKKLRSVRIWVEENEGHHPCMTYHLDAGWLREHGMNPEKARCVEIANARRFLEWTLDQPWMVLHELAHAYHHQFLQHGFENTDIKAAYDRAMAASLYGEVLYVHGGQKPSYAASNPMEFFAESTEAFFGTNDFYPFVRPELRKHDPATYDLLVKLWDDRA